MVLTAYINNFFFFFFEIENIYVNMCSKTRPIFSAGDYDSIYGPVKFITKFVNVPLPLKYCTVCIGVVVKMESNMHDINRKFNYDVIYVAKDNPLISPV